MDSRDHHKALHRDYERIRPPTQKKPQPRRLKTLNRESKSLSRRERGAVSVYYWVVIWASRTLIGIPTLRIIIFCGSILGPAISGNYHISRYPSEGIRMRRCCQSTFTSSYGFFIQTSCYKLNSSLDAQEMACIEFEVLPEALKPVAITLHPLLSRHPAIREVLRRDRRDFGNLGHSY